jgi:hypothetical protein
MSRRPEVEPVEDLLAVLERVVPRFLVVLAAHGLGDVR